MFVFREREEMTAQLEFVQINEGGLDGRGAKNPR